MVTSLHPYNRSNTCSTAPKYATARGKPCFLRLVAAVRLWGALWPCCLSPSSITAPRHGHTRPASACIHAPRRGQHFDPYRSSHPLQDLFERLKTRRSGTHAYAPQKGDIEVGVNSAVEVSTGRRDAPCSLEEAKVLRCYSKLPCGLADMPCSAVH
jgi:hypothetical protein